MTMLQHNLNTSPRPPLLNGDAQHQPQEFVQSTLDALSAHIAILDESGTIIGINNAWRRFAIENEYPSADYAIGINYLAVCDNASGRSSREAPLVAQAIRDILAGRIEEYYLEYPCHSPTTKRWFIAHITRFLWEGQPRLIISHQNVTELKQVQIQLDESKKRIEAILNNVANGIVSINARGRLESMNPAALQIFDCVEGDMIGEPLNVLFQAPYNTMPYRQLLATLQSQQHIELVGVRQDGSTFPMYFIISEIYLGTRRFFTGIVQDLTERKRMEAEILEKERISLALDKERELREFKNRFISLMSHELRTPLSSILLSSDLLKLYGDKVPDDERQLYLENINTQVEYLTSLVRDMLEMSRNEMNQLEFAPSRTDLVQLIQSIVEEFRINHESTHNILFSPKMPTLLAQMDIKLIRHAITNLLSNAIKYSPHGSTVRLDLMLRQDTIVLSVTDEGIGIPENDLPLLFEPFHRAGNVDNLPGTGLGLTVVKQSVELHGGEVRVESVQDKGTRFDLCLPYRH